MAKMLVIAMAFNYNYEYKVTRVTSTERYVTLFARNGANVYNINQLNECSK